MRQSSTKSNLPARSIRRILTNSWLWLGSAWILGLYLGFLGLYRYALISGASTKPLDLIYLLLQLITLESGAVQRPIPWELEVARFGLPALAAWTLVRTAMVIFREQAAQLSLQFWRDHIILCGLGRKGFLLLSDLLKEGEKVVVIESDEEHLSISQARSIGAVVLIGDATDPVLLSQARIEHARSLIAVMGDDGLNAEAAVRAESMLRDVERTPLHCMIHIVDPDLWDLLRAWEFSADRLRSLRLDLFNIYQRGAELLLAEYPIPVGGPIGHRKMNHVIVVGMGNLGRHLVLQLAEQWFRGRQDPAHKLTITVVDQKASEILDRLQARFPRLGDALDLHTEDINVRFAGFLHGDYLRDGGKGLDIHGVFICLDDDSLVLSTALTIKRQLSGVDTTIVIRMSEDNGLSRLVRMTTTQTPDRPGLAGFSLVERTCTSDLLVSGTHERLARALHASYVRAQDGPNAPEGSVLPWEQVSEEVRDANRSQADRMARLLLEAGFKVSLLRDWGKQPWEFSDNDIEILAKMEHKRWCQNKEQSGWKYAKGQKDDRARTHPDLVAWEDLPEPEKEKNRTPIRELPKILHQAGFMIRQG